MQASTPASIGDHFSDAIPTEVNGDGVLDLGRVRFSESESGFGLDSVNPSIQRANPNPDSRIQRIQFWRGFASETGSA